MDGLVRFGRKADKILASDGSTVQKAMETWSSCVVLLRCIPCIRHAVAKRGLDATSYLR